MENKATLDDYFNFNLSNKITVEVFEILEKCREAFNYLPRTELNEGDTYDLATELDTLFINLEK